jgi:hypothetical protein
MKKTAGSNQSFELARIGLGHCRRCGIFFEERRRNLIDGFVGRLRRKNRRDQQIKRAGVSQRAFGIRVELAQLFENADVPSFTPTFIVLPKRSGP